jgi:hypothetical protein
MLSGVQWEGYGGHWYGLREGKLCDVERCAVGMLWGHGYGVREGEEMCAGYRYGGLLCDVRQITM